VSRAEVRRRVLTAHAFGLVITAMLASGVRASLIAAAGVVAASLLFLHGLLSFIGLPLYTATHFKKNGNTYCEGIVWFWSTQVVVALTWFFFSRLQDATQLQRIGAAGLVVLSNIVLESVVSKV
jgi:hypothetical protein